jgi:hypothetical protein
MARRKTTDHLSALATIKKRDLDCLKRGVLLEQVFACSISELQVRVVRNRFGLAKHCLATAKRAISARPTSYRLAVGRSYYVMYHAVRSVAFFVHVAMTSKRTISSLGISLMTSVIALPGRTG